MTHYRWDDEKNRWLQQERGIRFEQIVAALEAGALLDELVHPNPERYPGQYVLIVKLEDYAYVVPSVVDGETYFLKSAWPSRKATRDYLGRDNV